METDGLVAILLPYLDSDLELTSHVAEVVLEEPSCSARNAALLEMVPELPAEVAGRIAAGLRVAPLTRWGFDSSAPRRLDAPVTLDGDLPDADLATAALRAYTRNEVLAGAPYGSPRGLRSLAVLQVDEGAFPLARARWAVAARASPQALSCAV